MILRPFTRGRPRVFLGATGMIVALALAGATAAQARIEVEDSPLFGKLLRSANHDLRDQSVASPPWKTQQVAEAIADFVYGSPASADSIHLTFKGEKTKCANQKITQCDKGKTQKCDATTQSQKKTDCGLPASKTYCKQNGTRCPGGTNQCLTFLPSQQTACVSGDRPTTCQQETSQCEASEKNSCVTVQGANDKTTCKDGSQNPTLCKQQPTGCSKAKKHYCKTLSGDSHERTYCKTNSNVSVCLQQVTNCTGSNETPDGGCELLSMTLTPENDLTPFSRSDDSKLLVVSADPTGPPFFGLNSEGTTGLVFNPPGPQVLDVNIYDQWEARFLVQLPQPPGAGTRDYNVIVFSGSNSTLTNGLLVSDANLPASSPAGIVVLAAVLIMLGSLLLIRRRTEIDPTA